MLRPGHHVTALPHRPLRVESELGSGGQGTVYRVTTDAEDMAVKWYFPDSATPDQREIIERLVDMGSPDERFLWPSALVVADGGREFGYLMDLRPSRYAGLPALFRRRVRTTPRALVAACIHVVEAYRTLHSRGIAYRDISWGNVFFDPANGDVLVCDNDNAVFEGHDTGIEGTMLFMAPELVRRDPGARPGTQTDLHALAVLLFMLLMNAHPLEGARELRFHALDLAAQRVLYGREPVFVYDPDDDSNRPVPGEHDTVIATWRVIPEALKAMFTTAFTVGLRNPNERVRESQWVELLSRVHDTLVYCGSCGRQNHFDELVFARSGHHGNCWSCRRPLALPPRLRLGDRSIMLNRDAVVCAHHLNRNLRHDFSAVVAAVTEHPGKPGVFGLTNRSQFAWTAERPDGAQRTVAPGETAPLRLGLRLQLAAGVEATIVDWSR